MAEHDAPHTVRTEAGSQHVVVRLDDQVVADSHRPVLLYETGLPVRYYLPEADVRTDLLTTSDETSFCPFKGTADRYWEAPGLGPVAWSYSDPKPAAAAVAGRICFYDDKVQVTADPPA